MKIYGEKKNDLCHVMNSSCSDIFKFKELYFEMTGLFPLPYLSALPLLCISAAIVSVVTITVSHR